MIFHHHDDHDYDCVRRVRYYYGRVHDDGDHYCCHDDGHVHDDDGAHHHVRESGLRVPHAYVQHDRVLHENDCGYDCDHGRDRDVRDPFGFRKKR